MDEFNKMHSGVAKMMIDNLDIELATLRNFVS